MTATSVNVSIGTAAVLGLARVPMAVPPTTAYLMLGGRCLMNCAFCAQARDSQADPQYLSRVTWPEYALVDLLPRLAEAAARGTLRRACLQVTVTAHAFEQALAVVRALRGARGGPPLPVDVAFLPHDLDQVRQMIEAGVDHLGFGLDAACERVFRQVKGGSWSRSLALIEETARSFPGHAALHLIVGLGETEREMVERIQWAHDLGVTAGLFAFTPIRGTHLADLSPPPLDAYRRMQAARWLIVHGQVRAEALSFDEKGRLAHPASLAASLPAGGTPFETSGCPDCNRPFYNEQPGGVMYNYPRPLTAEEAQRAVEEMDGV
jgi:biotin synthase